MCRKLNWVQEQNLILISPSWVKAKDSSPKGQEATDGHVHSRVFVPWLCRDLPGDVASSAGRLEATCSVLSHDAADDSEWEPHQNPGTQKEEHGGGWQSLGGAAPPVDRVHDTPCQEERCCGNELLLLLIMKVHIK